MGAQTYPPASRIFRFSHPRLDSYHESALITGSLAGGPLVLRRLVALVIALLLLLPMNQGESFAQQATYYGQ
jgi:hypothetical protein